MLSNQGESCEELDEPSIGIIDCNINDTIDQDLNRLTDCYWNMGQNLEGTTVENDT